jgi:glycosyltransferase involved in cell wall biosynthesis
MKPKISVIVPTYKSAAFIRETLGSIFAQTTLPDEVIVIDDCSPDQTCEIVELLRQDCPVELRLIRMEKNSGGPVGPMNAGVAAARSEYIAMLDHDDVMLPRRIEACLSAIIQDSTLGMVFGQMLLENALGEIQPLITAWYSRFGEHPKSLCARDIVEDLLHHDYSYGGAGGMLFRKSAWQQIGGFNESYTIVWDCDFAFQLALADWSAKYIPEVLYHHRIHELNLQRADAGKRLLHEHIRLYQSLETSGKFSATQVRVLRKRISSKYNHLANTSLLAKQYPQSAGLYFRSLTQGTWNLQAVKGFFRIPYYIAYKSHVNTLRKT